ncbi:hypothetical protein CYY_009413 [Polysphondylium violaceum]|uniref:Uncharacterized protein n=1 Tax=Polysphondylium violaceum TaxID=133409 RepID=A0A8J4V2Z5_9MYCE|nr:hypothetical protein CYY_009413 [Polysphondylium violaceum]
MIAVFVVILVLVGLVSTKVLHRYISIKKIPWYVYASVWIGWFMCFGIIILVPIDILCTDYRECVDEYGEDKCSEPYSYISSQALAYFYRTFYFGTLLLTWLLYPLLGSFVLAGDFHISQKIQTSVRENAYLYLIFGVIGFVIMIWLLAVKQLDWNSMVGFAMAAANTWGLCLVVVLMGYGLVETPRSIWNVSNRQLILKHLQFKAVDLLNAKKKATDELFSTMKAIKKIQDKTKTFDPYEKYIKIMVEQCPPEYSMIQFGEGTGEITYNALVSLNSRLKNAITNAHRAEFLYEQCCNEAFELQDIINSSLCLDKVVQFSFKQPRTGRFANLLNSTEWVWYNYLQVPTFRFMAILFAVISVVLLWSEISVSITSNDLSVLSLLVKHTNVSNLGIQILVFAPLGYAALTCYSTLFKIKIFNYYRLISHQHSDANSIIFSAAYLCRLASPLCYNFITFIQTDTTYSHVMGKMEVAPFLGKYFYIYFPLIIIVVALATLFNLYSRIMTCLNINKFRFDTDFSHEQIDEGKYLLENERRKWENKNKGPIDVTVDKFKSKSTISKINASNGYSTPSPLFSSRDGGGNGMNNSSMSNSPNAGGNGFTAFWKQKPGSGSNTPSRQFLDSSRDSDDGYDDSANPFVQSTTYNAVPGSHSPAAGSSGRLSSLSSGFPSIFGGSKQQPYSQLPPKK